MWTPRRNHKLHNILWLEEFVTLSSVFRAWSPRRVPVAAGALTAVIVVAALLLLVQSGTAAAQALTAEQEMFLGNKDAPVTVIEYASMTCPHCASFHIKNFPAIKKAYVDTGKVKFVFREFPLDRVAWFGSILARCSGEKRFFAFIDVMFRRQSNWARAEDPVKALSQLAQIGGVGKAEFEACLADKKLGDGILKTRLDGNNKFKVESTPSFVVNGKKAKGEMTVEALAKLVEPLLK